jgi:hypothetical protein
MTKLPQKAASPSWQQRSWPLASYPDCYDDASAQQRCFAIKATNG